MCSMRRLIIAVREVTILLPPRDNFGRKIDIINGAYSRMRISGLTIPAGAEEITLALRRLEQMARMFFAKNICVGYQFEDIPDPNSSSGIPIAHMDAFELCLANRLFADFGMTPAPTFMNDMRGAFSALVAASAPRRETQYPNRMPLGKITRLRYGAWNKFYHPEPRPEPGCETNKMLVGEVDDFVESFEAYLNNGESVLSFTTNIDPGLTLVSSSVSSTHNEIVYRIKADKNNESGQYRSFYIAATTTEGRVVNRVISFDIVGFNGENNA